MIVIKTNIHKHDKHDKDQMTKMWTITGPSMAFNNKQDTYRTGRFFFGNFELYKTNLVLTLSCHFYTIIKFRWLNNGQRVWNQEVLSDIWIVDTHVYKITKSKHPWVFGRSRALRRWSFYKDHIQKI